MSAEPADVPPPAKPKRKYRRRRKARAQRPAAIAKPAGGEFAGLTPLRCCEACNPAEGCYITREGSGICARGTALQAPDMLRPEVIRRYNNAQKYLAHAAADRKHR